ncbi:HigA family addiction module antitoxin [Cognatishimia activa]|uniref:HigA family addiction module antitoxin n=1 Tax=Cognatishimia activa TaxID=1715691 RepID=UPI00222E8BBE|nr:HigA family addiction module antitoxin [Cognatishimia activa]
MHPGEVLTELYMNPLQLSSSKLAKALGVPRSRVEQILGGKSKITTDTARRLARVFRTSPELWLKMQNAHDLQKDRPA